MPTMAMVHPSSPGACLRGSPWPLLVLGEGLKLLGIFLLGEDCRGQCLQRDADADLFPSALDEDRGLLRFLLSRVVVLLSQKIPDFPSQNVADNVSAESDS